jgi:hypothetical protein
MSESAFAASLAEALKSKTPTVEVGIMPPELLERAMKVKQRISANEQALRVAYHVFREEDQLASAEGESIWDAFFAANPTVDKTKGCYLCLKTGRILSGSISAERVMTESDNRFENEPPADTELPTAESPLENPAALNKCQEAVEAQMAPSAPTTDPVVAKVAGSKEAVEAQIQENQIPGAEAIKKKTASFLERVTKDTDAPPPK